MKISFRIQGLVLSIVFFICLLFYSESGKAQDKNVTDTIDFIIKNKKSNQQLIDDLNILGNYYVDIGKKDFAKMVADKTLELAKKEIYDKGLYDTYAVLGTVAILTNDFEKAQAIADEWLNAAAKYKSNFGKDGANYLQAKIYFRQGNIDTLISFSKRNLEVIQKQESFDSLYFAKFNAILGNAYFRSGDFRNANQFLINALVIAEKINNEQIQSACIGNLAIINKELKNYGEALKYNRKALALRIKNNQMHDVAGTYSNMASCYENIKMLDSAEYFYRKALALFIQLDSRDNIALVKNNLGQVLMDLNIPDSALYYLQSARKDLIILSDTIKLALNAWAIGNVWHTLGYKKSNRSYYEKALFEMTLAKNLAELKLMTDLKMSIYKSLSQIYESLDQPGRAFEFLKKYSVINDSIRSQAYTNQIAEMQTIYETEKKETEITKLNSEKLLDSEKIARQKTLNYSLITIAGLILISVFLFYKNVQKKREAEKHIAILEKQNAIESMRSKIASDVHDDMGANLTRIGLYSQQLLQEKNIADKERQLLEKISIQSKEVTIGMKEIIWASNPANDNLKSMLGFMRQYIDRFFDGTDIRPIVNFPQNAGEIMLHPEVRRNLFLILKESLNNALKYSGTDKMDIDFNAEGDKFNFSVKDYGKGIDDKAKDEFSNGMRNMRLRAEQIKSAFKMVSSPGGGVQIFVEGKLY